MHYQQNLSPTRQRLLYLFQLHHQRTQPVQMSVADWKQSEEWQACGKIWVEQVGHRCQMFPWVPIGKVAAGRYQGYHIHHINSEAYQRIGMERLNEDVLALSPMAHLLVFHYLLTGGKTRVRYQQIFPNRAQAIANGWCRLPQQWKLNIAKGVFFTVLILVITLFLLPGTIKLLILKLLAVVVILAIAGLAIRQTQRLN